MMIQWLCPCSHRASGGHGQSRLDRRYGTKTLAESWGRLWQSGTPWDNILVMVVEDDGMILLGLEAALHDGGYSTISESSGEAAIDKLETTPEIRSLITDINLIGEASGWDVARRA